MEQKHDNCDLENVGDSEEESSDGDFEALISTDQSQTPQDSKGFYHSESLCKGGQAKVGENQDYEV